MAKISNISTPDGTTYDIRATAIPFGKVDSTSTKTAFTATVPGITELTDGVCCYLMNGVVTSDTNFTINVNGLGAKPSYNNLAAATRDTTLFNVNYTMLFVYNSQRVSGGCWDCYRGYDANTNTIGYQLRTNSMSLPMDSITYRYRLLFTSADGTHFVPATNSTSTNATASRTVCQSKIDPFGRIVYYGTTASVSAGSRPSAAYLWDRYTISLGYSFNRTGAALTLTSWEPVYIKCTPQSDGSAIIDATTPYVQALPTAEDGKIYIFLGVAYSATNIELIEHHSVYYYKDGAIRLWTNGITSTGGSTVSVSQTLTSGTEIAEITVDNVGTKLYAPTLPTLATVATTGDYDDLTDKPTIPTATSELTNDSGFLTSAVTSFNGNTGAVTYTAPVTSVNGQTGAVTVTEGLTPLIGTTSTVTATEVKMAVEEGRDVCISYTHSTYGVLEFTSFNVANSMHSVVSQTIVNYNSTILCFELIGVMLSEDTQELWLCTVDTLASSSDIPTTTSDLTNDSGFLTSSTAVTSFNGSVGAITYTAPVTSVNGSTGAITGLATDSSVVHLASAETITGEKTFTADTTVSGADKVLNLHGAAASNSAILRFQRGTLSDNYNDWQIQDRGGYLYFDERGSGSTAWTNRVMFNTTGGIQATTFSGQLSGSISSGTTATTQTAGDNSTKVATTAFVQNALPTVPTNVSAFTNDSGYITSSALSSYVPTSRTVNNKALSNNITLSVTSTASSTNTDILKSVSVSGKKLVIGAATLSIT